MLGSLQGEIRSSQGDKGGNTRVTLIHTPVSPTELVTEGDSCNNSPCNPCPVSHSSLITKKAGARCPSLILPMCPSHLPCRPISTGLDSFHALSLQEKVWNFLPYPEAGKVPAVLIVPKDKLNLINRPVLWTLRHVIAGTSFRAKL